MPGVGLSVPGDGSPQFGGENSETDDNDTSVDKLSSGGEGFEEEASCSNTSVENTRSSSGAVFPCMDQNMEEGEEEVEED